jgi:hypothetical protein
MITSRHNRAAFFKYYTASSAKLTLANGSRKWSTPFLFNDPFDNQFDLDFPEPTPELVKQQTEQFHALLRSSEPFRPDYFESKEICVAMEYLRQIHQANPDFQYSEDDLAYVEGGTLQGMQNVRKTTPDASAEIRRIMADTTIFCVSETHDNILMWSHYAENHTGAVIEFLAAPEVDSPLLVAQPVRYSQEMPRLRYDIMMMDSKKARMEVLDIITLSKSEVWAYEKEWRVWATLRNKTQTYEIIPFALEEIGAVYLGCKMAESDKVEIAEIVGRKYPKARLFAAEKHPSRFELTFNELTGLTKS